MKYEGRCSLTTRVSIFAVALAAAYRYKAINDLTGALISYGLLELMFKNFFGAEIKSFFKRQPVIPYPAFTSPTADNPRAEFVVEAKTIIPSFNFQMKKSIESQRVEAGKRIAEKQEAMRSEILRQESERYIRVESERRQKKLIASLIRTGSVVAIKRKRPIRKKRTVKSRLIGGKRSAKKSS